VRVLDGVSIDVRPGESVAVAGAAGTGKSTLLLILAGALRPERGTISWMTSDGRTTLDAAGLGYLPPWKRAHAIQNLRRAVEQPPGFLLIDDILSVLDFVQRREARSLLRELQVARVTMLMACRPDSHGLSLCNRVVLLRNGKAH
jgi:ABC-type cobalamin/Fe3+-siderophores transport system ATPase subunit